jgi:hypothetical protein
MGLFSGHRRAFRTHQLRSPIRLHSEYSLGSFGHSISRLPGATWKALVAATNDSRVVGAALVVAALALALEMAISIGQ